MKFFNFFAIFFLGVALYQVEANPRPSPESIQDQIQEALEQLRNIIQAGIDEAEDTYNNIENQVRSSIDDVVDISVKAIQDGMQPLVDLVNLREKEAEEKGLDTSGCDDLKNELLDIPNDYGNRIKEKTGDILDDLNAKLTAQFDDIRDLTKIVDDLEEELAVCNNILCLPGILAKATGYLVTVPATIADIIAKDVEYAAKATKDASELGLSMKLMALERAAVLSQQVIECLLACPTKRPTSSTTQRSSSTTTQRSSSTGRSTTDNGGGSTSTDNGGGSSSTDNGGGSSSTDNGGGSSSTDNGGGSSTTDRNDGSTDDGGSGSSTSDDGNGGSSTSDDGGSGSSTDNSGLSSTTSTEGPKIFESMYNKIKQWFHRE